MNIFYRLWNKLRNKAYRDAFVSTQLKRGLPFQIRAMRKKLGWSQADLAKASNLSQGVVSRAEDSDYGNLTFNTVLRIAAGLDVAFVGRLVPFSDAANWFSNLSEESVQVPTFKEEEIAITTAGQSMIGTEGMSVGSLPLRNANWAIQGAPSYLKTYPVLGFNGNIGLYADKLPIQVGYIIRTPAYSLSVNNWLTSDHPIAPPRSEAKFFEPLAA